MTLSGRQWTIAAGDHAATVVEVGAGLLRYEADGRDVTCTYGEGVLPPKGCGMTLVPWPNRLAGGRYEFEGVTQQLALTEPDKGNAIHGLGRWARWTPAREAADSVTLALDVVPQKGYPFEVRAEITYRVDPDHGLDVTIEARNLGAGPAPFGAGCHPYVSTGGVPLDDVTLTLPVTAQFTVDERQIPTGTTPVADLREGVTLGERRFDLGFAGVERGPDGRAEAIVRTPQHTTRLWLDESFNYLQAYTVDEVTPGQPGIAIEPMSCAPNAFNSGDGLVVLEPGAAWRGRWGITPER